MFAASQRSWSMPHSGLPAAVPVTEPKSMGTDIVVLPETLTANLSWHLASPNRPVDTSRALDSMSETHYSQSWLHNPPTCATRV